MATLDYRVGSPTPICIRVLEADGSATDITATTMELRLPILGACLPVSGTLVEDAEGDFWEVSLSGMALPHRLLPGAIWVDWGRGHEYLTTVYINITGGC